MPPRTNEEDVDDLDDVLEEFGKPAPIPSRPPIPPVLSQQPSTVSSLGTSKVSSTISNANNPGDDTISEEFAKQFAAEMEAMMRTLGDQSSSSPETEEAKKFREAWEKMVIEDLEADGRGNDLLAAKPVASGEDSKQKEKVPSDTTGDGKEDPFQKAIRQAIDKLHDSDETLKADTKNPASQDALANLLSTLGEFNLEDGEDGEGEGLETMLETMMSQLMSKEILYEPLKELHTKYPEYLNEKKSSLPPEEFHRYTLQSERVSQIVAMFEKETYSDEDSTQSTEILRLMNEMQSFGSPPTEIMGDMPPGFEFGEDGLPKLPEGCTIC